ncbi:hypothetical protein PMAYCL1PPCAC_33000, partial [Pristionchus mayeri]
SSLEITIVIILTRGSNQKDYATAINSLECYAALHGYSFIVQRDDRFEECAVHNDKFFRRHCHTHRLMLTEITADSWVLFIDADNGIINPNRLIEEFIDPHYDIYLYNRFYNWEFAAQYLVKNNNLGQEWLKKWADFEFKLPDSEHGSDNGALHILMMEMLLPESSNAFRLGRQCISVWTKSAGARDLFSMEACVRTVIGERNTFSTQRVKIFHKTESWAQDLWLLHSHWSEDNFMMHALKEK